MLETTEFPSHMARAIRFSMYGEEEIKKISVKEVTNTQAFDALLHPTYGGLYDPALGPSDLNDICPTCTLSSSNCPGHMGHITLPLPVYNPVLFKIMMSLLKLTCFTCHRLLGRGSLLQLFHHQMKALELGLIGLVDELRDIYHEMIIERGGDKGLEDEVADRLSDTICSAIKDLDVEDATKHSNVKNVVAFRTQLIQEFLRGKYFFKTSCPHCKMPVRPLKSEHTARIFFFKSVGRKQALKVLNHRKKQKEKQGPNDDDTEQVIMEGVTQEGSTTPTPRTGSPTELTPAENTKAEADALEAELIKIMGESLTYLSPEDIRSHLREVWQRESIVLTSLFGALSVKVNKSQHPTDIFFLTTLPVAPTKFRPMVRMGEQQFMHEQSVALTKVMEDKLILLEILKEVRRQSQPETKDLPPDKNTAETLSKVPGGSLYEKLNSAWIRLQIKVNGVIDSDLDKLSNDKIQGIKQNLEKLPTVMPGRDLMSYIIQAKYAGTTSQINAAGKSNILCNPTPVSACGLDCLIILLEKKEGLFRKHMMGKRVNYAARSVISPDPYISTDEIGIPDIFAKKLTFPQPVTPWNFHELKQAVINGPLILPGAVKVINEDGSSVMLKPNDQTQREAVAKQLLTPSANSQYHIFPCKQVYRHLKNGDILLLNRQPTLHRPSIQAHKARILPKEKTLRLHYANCKAYNADFDGDEMNAHFPQDEISRAEAYNLVATKNSYLVPKDGTPLAGLIQDHMVSGVHLTIRGRFFDRNDYQQLVYRALTDKPGSVITLPPAILKPQCLWSGKQVFSTLLLNLIPEDKPPLNLIGKAKVSPKNFQNKNVSPMVLSQLNLDNMGEGDVVILKGELLQGVLDKGHYGNTPYGLVHCCYELYGGHVSGQLLTCLARLFTSFLQMRGFTLGVEDILVTRKADHKRRKVMKEIVKCGVEVSAQALNIENPDDPALVNHKMREAQFTDSGSALKDLDLCMKGKTDDFQNKIAKVVMPQGLEKKFPHNNLQLMVQSGAKGSLVNCLQISCLLGQIELEGRRPPLMMSGQSLPSFLPYDPSPRAGGFVAGRFLTGIRPQEYFFHCMAGREGLIDTAVKTSRSGYLQRCIIKHLEGLTVSYDLTVRDSDGSVIQFQYGEDGLDIQKTQFLNQKQFPFLVKNQNVFTSAGQLEDVQSKLDTKGAKKLWKKLKKWYRKCPKSGKTRISPFLSFSKSEWESVTSQFSATEVGADGRSLAVSAICRRWYELEKDRKRKFTKQKSESPDPVVSEISQHHYFGAVSERIEGLIENYINSNPDRLLEGGEDEDVSPGNITENTFRKLIYMRNLQALVDPGEAVGLLAAQSIGEPSTQMTLNTFHFAGRGEMNVTLGIPRLREILMVASTNIKTPTMDIPLIKCRSAYEKGQQLKLKLNKVCLNQVLEEVTVEEKFVIRSKMDKARFFKMKFQFLRYETYQDEFNLNAAKILQFMEKKFFKQLAENIRRRILELESMGLTSTGTVVERKRNRKADKEGGGDGDDDVEEDDLHDGDATATRNRERQMEDVDYQGEEEEKEEVGEEPEEEEDEEDEGEETVEGETTSAVEENEDAEDAGDVDTPESSHSNSPVVPAVEMSQQRINSVIGAVGVAEAYSYDAAEELWCEITMKFELKDKKVDLTSLIESLAKKTVVYQVPNISRCFLSESKKPGEEGVWRLKTEGINIQEIYKYQNILNLDKLYTNDIHAIARHYGIEAAARTLVQEVRDVFAAYGIQVDYRHLSLVGDYMTFEGIYKPFNRMGLDSNASPLQKMTFETTMNFLKNATVQGAQDDLRSPSSRLVVGKLVGLGTGAFDLLQPLNI